MKTSVDKVEMKEREDYAESLRKREDIPSLNFEQGSDGVFRVVVPREIPVTLKLTLRPKTAPTHYPQFHLKKRHHEHLTMAERVEKLIEEVRWKKPVLLEKLEKYKKEVKAKKLKDIEKSGHNFIEENIDVNGFLEFKKERDRSLKLKNEMKHVIALQKRNSRQYEQQSRKVSATREIMNAKKLRQKAMAEFILQQGLRKNNNTQKSWLAILVTCKTANNWSHILTKARAERHRNAQVKAMMAISIFALHKIRRKRKKRSADTIIGFLKFIQRDGQIKQIAKKLKWILLKLQKLMHERIICNHAQVELISKKYEKVMDVYLPECEKKRQELERLARKQKFASKNSKNEAKVVTVPDPKIPLEPEFKKKAIGNWVIKNRQNHVLKLMAYEEYDVWPVLTDMVREKALFGNPLDARKFCKSLRKRGAMVNWIRENGGENYIEPPPVYKRIPTDEHIIEEIYEVARVRSARKTQQNKDLQEMQLLLQKELGLNLSLPSETIKDKANDARKSKGERKDNTSIDSDRSGSSSKRSARRSGRRSSISRKGGGTGGRRTTSNKGARSGGISAQGSVASVDSADTSSSNLKTKRSTRMTKRKVRIEST
mmetsp:Transcript_17914/g.37246  ORF Transcript_17914/g.37246 Transcript_17914/m.37246 type:complete len:600 (+) Transcript_17914:161-1960(+)